MNKISIIIRLNGFADQLQTTFKVKGEEGSWNVNVTKIKKLMNFIQIYPILGGYFDLPTYQPISNFLLVQNLF